MALFGNFMEAKKRTTCCSIVALLSIVANRIECLLPALLTVVNNNF